MRVLLAATRVRGTLAQYAGEACWRGTRLRMLMLGRPNMPWPSPWWRRAARSRSQKSAARVLPQVRRGKRPQPQVRNHKSAEANVRRGKRPQPQIRNHKSAEAKGKGASWSERKRIAARRTTTRSHLTHSVGSRTHPPVRTPQLASEHLSFAAASPNARSMDITEAPSETRRAPKRATS